MRTPPFSRCAAVTHQRRVADHRVLCFFARCGDKPQADVIEACVDRARHHLGRSKFEYR
jgi:hypothetical protein